MTDTTTFRLVHWVQDPELPDCKSIDNIQEIDIHFAWRQDGKLNAYAKRLLRNMTAYADWGYFTLHTVEQDPSLAVGAHSTQISPVEVA